MSRECHFFRGADRILERTAHWQVVDSVLEKKFGEFASRRGRRPRFSAAWLFTFLVVRLTPFGWDVEAEPVLRGRHEDGIAWPFLRFGSTVLAVSELNSVHVLAALARFRMMSHSLELNPASQATDAILVLADFGGDVDDREVARLRMGSSHDGLLLKAFREVAEMPLMVLRVSPGGARNNPESRRLRARMSNAARTELGGETGA